MSRLCAKRLCATATLVATSPISVGGEEASLSDSSIFLDGLGRPVIPGTSFGPLRAHFERMAMLGGALNEEQVDVLFGPLLNDDDGNRILIQKSGSPVPMEPAGGHLVVHDALATNFAFSILEDGVAINRRLGSAIPRLKYDRLAVPIGTRFAFAVDIELSGMITEEVARLFLSSLQRAFREERIAVGRGKTTGAGRLRAEKVEVGVLDFSSKYSTIDTLLAMSGTGVAPGGFDLDQPGSETRPSMGYLDISVRWTPELPVIQSVQGRGGIEIVPLVTPNDADHVCLALKGSGIKGALRAVSEWLVRSATQWDAPESPSDQMAMSRSELTLVNALWGAPRREDDSEARESEEDEPKVQTAAGAVSVHYCLSNTSIAKSAWDKLVSVEHGFFLPRDEVVQRQRVARELEQFHSNHERVRLEHTNHNAINRWTGGASRGALFDRLVVVKGDWGSIRLELDYWFLERRLPDEGNRRAALALLLLTLRAMHEGDGSLGFGGTRGLGRVRIDAVTLRGSERQAEVATSEQHEWWSQLCTPEGELSEKLSATFRARVTELEAAWKAWVGANMAPEAVDA